MGKLFYLMGKSVSGKDTIYKQLLNNEKLGLKDLVIYTTRPIRAGELDGREYHFVNEVEFQRLQSEGKVIEAREYQTVHGLWRYFTADTIDLNCYNYLGIGTLESYGKIRTYYGEDRVCPIYVEVEDGERLKRAIAREELQAVPKYEEMCRRFLADSKDFCEENVKKAEIKVRFQNNDFNTCLLEIEKYLVSMLY